MNTKETYCFKLLTDIKTIKNETKKERKMFFLQGVEPKAGNRKI